jgi:hypothetical protein
MTLTSMVPPDRKPPMTVGLNPFRAGEDRDEVILSALREHRRSPVLPAKHMGSELPDRHPRQGLLHSN